MRGTVLAYRPNTGSGAIVTDSGQVFLFAIGTEGRDLHGGDIVRFQMIEEDCPVTSTADSMVRVIEIIRRAVDQLSNWQDPLISRLYRTVLAESPVS
ncbi:MAG: hypothetical protein ACE5EQ_10165 [Phycisphaerae bacterium]